MKVALVITTYNWPQALASVLDSVLEQRRMPDEVLVADDGSRTDTAAVIADRQPGFPVPLRHLWQPDEGFRAARVRNLAIAAATCPYIIVIDGDMLLHPGFVAGHLRAAAPGRFVQGSRVLLDAERTARVFAGDTRVSWIDRGIGNRLNMLDLPFAIPWCSREDGSTHATRSCSMGFWRDDALRVNGFNEAFVGWGREDSEFAQRLLNAGLRRLRLRCGAVAFHLYHRERARSALAANDALLRRTERERLTWCDAGIDRHLAGANANGLGDT